MPPAPRADVRVCVPLRATDLRPCLRAEQGGGLIAPREPESQARRGAPNPRARAPTRARAPALRRRYRQESKKPKTREARDKAVFWAGKDMDVGGQHLEAMTEQSTRVPGQRSRACAAGRAFPVMHPLLVSG